MTGNEISCQLTSHLPGDGKWSQPLVASPFNLEEHMFLAWKCKIWIQCVSCLRSHVRQYNGTWKKRSNLLSVEEMSSRAAYYFKMCLRQQSLWEPLSHKKSLTPIGSWRTPPSFGAAQASSDLALFTALSSLKEPQNKTNLMGASLWQSSLLLSHLQNHTCYLQANKLLQSSDRIPHHPKSCFHFSRLSLELSVSSRRW